MTAARRGFTLVELLIAMVLLAVVGAAMYALLINSQRLSRRQIERSDLQADVRAGALILPAELREIGYDGAGTDLQKIAVDSIRFRAMRGIGMTCGITATQLYLVKPIFGDIDRAPKVTDTLLIFVDHNQDQAADDQWLKKGITAIDMNSTCPAFPTQAAIKVTLNVLDGDLSALIDPLNQQLFLGGPVRFYEVMQMGLYTADGKSWLGARSTATEASYQPVLGPLADGNGVEFKYYDAASTEIAVTGDRNAIRSIKITFHGRSDEPVWTGRGERKPVIDTLSLTARVALRNNTRP